MASRPEPAEETKRQPKRRDGFILLCIVVVSAAIGAMLFTQFGLSMPASIGAGVGAWIFFMLVHKQVQKSAQIAELKAELARARFQGARPRPASARGMQLSPYAGGAMGAETRQPDFVPSESKADTFQAAPGAGRTASPHQPAPGLSGQRFAANTDVPSGLGIPPRTSASAPRGLPRQADRSAPDTAADAPASIDLTGMRLPPNTGTSSPIGGDAAAAREEGSQPRSEIARDQWSFRPRSESQVVGAAATASRATTTVEGDLELVQRKIRELADEVNFVEASRPAKTLRADMRSTPTTDAIEHSIGALKAAAHNMRERPNLGDFIPKLTPSPAEGGNAKSQSLNKQAGTKKAPPPASEPALPGLGELVIPATAERIAGSDFRDSQSPAAPELAEPSLDLPFPDLPSLDLSLGSASAAMLPPRAKEIVRAIEHSDMDIFLAPIVTLAAHSVNHYEMTIALKSGEGGQLDAREEDFTLIGRDLGAKFDVERLHRAAALSIRMEARDKDGSLLTSVMGSSLSSRLFLETIARIYETRPKIATQLVVTLTQRAIDDFTPTVWQALRDMHAFGFRFALDKIEHMRTDFAALSVAGFRFLRLEPHALFEGFAAPDRFIPANEINQRAQSAGLSIIASGIADAKAQKRLLEAGVDLGQGPLFGEPRQVMLDISAGRSAAA
jgi:cyclic-di-GMP phosphodiesterase TipF (flagellum assembly factor)